MASEEEQTKVKKDYPKPQAADFCFSRPLSQAEVHAWIERGIKERFGATETVIRLRNATKASGVYYVDVSPQPTGELTKP